jgi:hypothetical protein
VQAVLSVFTATELETVLCGAPDIDVDDWERHTLYSELSARSATVRWFWQTVREFDAEVRVGDVVCARTGGVKGTGQGSGGLGGWSLLRLSLPPPPKALAPAGHNAPGCAALRRTAPRRV